MTGDEQGRSGTQPWRRSLQFTREGKYFVGITMGIGFAAINTGNNLLYLLLGMMLSLIIASGVMSEVSLRGIEVVREAPSRIHARRPFLMGIGLSNHKRWLPSFSVEVEDLLDGRPLDKKCYFLKLPPGRLQHTSYRHTIARRGRYTFTGFRVSTKFPFALFRKSRLIELRTQVIVFPLLTPVTHVPPRALALGNETLRRLGRRGEFHGLRESREGDDPRDIHWRSTARKGRAMVREHEDEAGRRVTIFLDNALPSEDWSGDEIAQDQLERAISLAASLAADHLQRGYTVRLVTRSESEEKEWTTGMAQLPRVLGRLALLPTAAPTTPMSAAPDGRSDPIFVAPSRDGGRVSVSVATAAPAPRAPNRPVSPGRQKA